MNIDHLVKTIHLSIAKANKDHEKWTGGSWIQDYGVEGFLVSRIADGIMSSKQESKPGFLTLETSFAELYQNCGRLPSGKRSKYSKDNNRVDLALYYKSSELSHVVEVKRHWSPACKEDLYRLCSLYNKYSRSLGKDKLKDALFVQLVKVCSKRNPSRLKDQLWKYFSILEQRCEDIVSKQGLTCQFYRGLGYYKPILLEDNTEIFSSLCVRLRPKHSSD